MKGIKYKANFLKQKALNSLYQNGLLYLNELHAYNVRLDSHKIW